MITPRVWLVTSRDVPFEHVLRVARSAGASLPRGDFAVQLRDKRATGEELAAAVEALGDVPVVVNGADLATSIDGVRGGAAGVHVSGSGLVRGDVRRARAALGPDALVSAAAHADDDVARAAGEGANVVLVSPIFATPGAEKAAPCGTDALRAACRVLEASGARERVAVVALGGITVEGAAACAAAGAEGVAVVRALAASGAAAAAAVRALAAPFEEGLVMARRVLPEPSPR